jgi:hypothetical protein
MTLMLSWSTRLVFERECDSKERIQIQSEGKRSIVGEIERRERVTQYRDSDTVRRVGDTPRGSGGG